MRAAEMEEKWGSSSCAQKLQRDFPGLFLSLRVYLSVSAVFLGLPLFFLHQSSAQPLLQPSLSLWSHTTPLRPSLHPSLKAKGCRIQMQQQWKDLETKPATSIVPKEFWIIVNSFVDLNLVFFFLNGSLYSSLNTGLMRVLLFCPSVFDISF